MSESLIEIYADPEVHGEIRSTLRKIPGLGNTVVKIIGRKVKNDLFYAENEIVKKNRYEVFIINISAIVPKSLVRDVVNIELHKAILYFKNEAVKAFRWHAGKIFYDVAETLIERSIYAKLVDTVENAAVTKFNPKLSNAFLNVFLENEVYDNILDYVISQSMLVPVITGNYVAAKNPDDAEALALLLSSYGEEMVNKPIKEKGIEVAEELFF